MKTIYDYQRKILSQLKIKENLNIKELMKKVGISKFQERSNFLNALFNLEINGEIYNRGKNTYILFPKNLYTIDKVISKDNRLYLEKKQNFITDKMTNGKTLLENDIIIVNKNNLKIIKVIKHDIDKIKDYLLQELNQHNLTYKQIKHLALAKDTTSICKLNELLKTLERTGKIFYQNKEFKKWPSNIILAKLKTNSNNELYFEIDGKKYYKNQNEIHDLFDGDIIAVSKKGKHIVKVIDRTKTEIILEVVEIDGIKQLEPILLPNKGKMKVRIGSNDMKHLKIGDRIKAKISLDTTDDYLEASYISTIGNINDPDIDLKSVIIKHGFDIDFSNDAITCAKKMPTTINVSEHKERYDLRKRFTTFTIDCDNTKDIDDAVSIMKDENGNYILAVHIADVAHYVTRNSILDKEAYKRNLSLYPINSVIPMLPKELSNGICSLNPNEPRLTKTYIMEISKTGELLNYQIINSIIESKIKMSYSKVNQILDNNEEIEEYKPFIKDLKLMMELSNILTTKMKNEGMLTFYEEENNYISDKNSNIIKIEPKSNGTAGKIIENFMIMYNHCQSLYLNYIVGTSINRVHNLPEEEKLTKAFEKLHNLGYNLPKINSLDINSYIRLILNTYQDSNDFNIVSDIILKALPRAHYTTNPTGHFGLNLDYYTHSTSPIRRYPDLKAQQIIDSYQQGKLYEIEKKEVLEEICNYSSQREKEADLVEKEAALIKMLKYVDRHINKSFYGTITEIDNERIYLKTVTNIPGYINLTSLDNVTFIKSKSYLKNDFNEVILKVGNFVKVQAQSTNHKELLVNFKLIKNLTLSEYSNSNETSKQKKIIKNN